MKRGPKPADMRTANQGDELITSTYKLQKTIKLHLQFMAVMTGRDQSDIVREAIDEYLRNREIDPSEPPQVIIHPLTIDKSQSSQL
jgi:hypothetical protein